MQLVLARDISSNGQPCELLARTDECEHEPLAPDYRGADIDFRLEGGRQGRLDGGELGLGRQVQFADAVRLVAFDVDGYLRAARDDLVADALAGAHDDARARRIRRR